MSLKFVSIKKAYPTWNKPTYPYEWIYCKDYESFETCSQDKYINNMEFCKHTRYTIHFCKVHNTKGLIINSSYYNTQDAINFIGSDILKKIGYISDDSQISSSSTDLLPPPEYNDNFVYETKLNCVDDLSIIDEIKNLPDNLHKKQRLRIKDNKLVIETRYSFMRRFTKDSRWKVAEKLNQLVLSVLNFQNNDEKLACFNKLSNIMDSMAEGIYKNDTKWIDTVYYNNNRIRLNEQLAASISEVHQPKKMLNEKNSYRLF